MRSTGRERELGELRAGHAGAVSGRGCFFLIGGEPGIGKTRLVDELAAEATQQGAQVLWGRCWEDGGAPGDTKMLISTSTVARGTA